MQASRAYILDTLDYVVALARSYGGRGLDHEDLIAAGNLGLVEAARRFDRSRNVKFITYADWWIRKAMREALAGNGPVRLPRYQRDRLRMLAASRTRLTHAAARRPARDELVQESGFSGSEVDRLLQLVSGTVSLDHAPGATGQGPVLNEVLPDRAASCPLSTVVNRDLVDELRCQLGGLNERERAVLTLRFGLSGDALTLREAGRRLGLGRESVRQLELRALTKLRDRLAS